MRAQLSDCQALTYTQIMLAHKEGRTADCAAQQFE